MLSIKSCVWCASCVLDFCLSFAGCVVDTLGSVPVPPPLLPGALSGSNANPFGCWDVSAGRVVSSAGFAPLRSPLLLDLGDPFCIEILYKGYWIDPPSPSRLVIAQVL